MRYITKCRQFWPLAFVFVTAFVQAESAEVSGKVAMKGLIYDSACSIETGTLDQTVDMGNTPMNELLEKGVGPSMYFTIRLIDCDFGKKPNGVKGDLSITFDGQRDGDWFAVGGDARGVALRLTNEAQSSVIPGKAQSLIATTKHDVNNITSLVYQIQLVKNGETLSSGEYRTTLNFTIDYN